MRALKERPDFRAAELGITAAQSQYLLAKANGKVDVNGTYDISHVSGETTGSVFASFELPIFNRNQGEIARTNYALAQAKEARTFILGKMAEVIKTPREQLWHRRKSRSNPPATRCCRM